MNDNNKNNVGYVYIMTNPSYPGIVKIGITGDTPEARRQSLDNTSVPTPFEIYATLKTDKYEDCEKLLHNTYGNCRVRPNREFFRTDPDSVYKSFKHLAKLIDGEYALNETDDTEDQTTNVETSDNAKKNVAFWTFAIPKINKIIGYDAFDATRSLQWPIINTYVCQNLKFNHLYIGIPKSRTKELKFYVDLRYGNDLDELYNNAVKNKANIEKLIGTQLDIMKHSDKQTSIGFTVDTELSVDNDENWEDIATMLGEYAKIAIAHLVPNVN